MIKRIFKILVIGLLSIIAIVGLLFVAAFVLSRIEVKAEKQKAADVSIYIMTNGDHIDFVLPTRNNQKDWSKEIKFEYTLEKDTTMQYLALGWGDKGFYIDTPTWAQLKYSTAFKAMFGLNTTAMHATYYKTIKEDKDCKKINLSKAQYTRLIHFIDSSFQKDYKGHYKHIKTNANYGQDDAFYEAVGKYTMFYTCNTWANEGLKACGQKACLWTPFDTGVFNLYNK